MVLPELKREFNIPEGVEVEFENRILTVSGTKGTLSKKLIITDLQPEIEGDKVTILIRFPSTRKTAIFGMQASLIQNMIVGVQRGFKSRLKVISSHFPITTEVREGEVLINNFLGERYPRKAKVHNGVEVGVEGEFLTVTGSDRDGVAQTAANIEQATLVRNRDRRVFQDGIYLIEKTAPVEE
jgi:large subunit ribosomal protein L6